MKPTISILGGDLRQVYLARLLQADGWDAVTWGLEQGGGPSAVPLDQALERKVLLLPMPIERDGLLHLPLTDTELETEHLWPRLRYDQLLLGGLAGTLRQRLMMEYGLTLLDYYAREETQVANAVPTASAMGHTRESWDQHSTFPQGVPFNAGTNSCEDAAFGNRHQQRDLLTNRMWPSQHQGRGLACFAEDIQC